MIVCDLCMDYACEKLWIDAVTHRCCACEEREEYCEECKDGL